MIIGSIVRLSNYLISSSDGIPVRKSSGKEKFVVIGNFIQCSRWTFLLPVFGEFGCEFLSIFAIDEATAQNIVKGEL